MSPRHVVLVTYGEPPTDSFASQLVYSWRILLGLTRRVAAIPPWLIPIIAVMRARLRHQMWRSERYGSPLERLTREQATALGEALRREAPRIEWRVHAAYEFRRPLLTECLESLVPAESVTVVPMYAANSAFTHELTCDAVERWRARRGAGAEVQVLPPLDEEALAEALSAHVMHELARRDIRPDAEWGLMLAAHGTLLEPPRPMETGRLATERIAAAIGRRLRRQFGGIHLGWLNHTYGGRWTEPAMDVALHNLAGAGLRRVVYFPFGFLADNAETELEGRQALRLHPELEAVHLPSVNAQPEFIALLARRIARQPIEPVIGASESAESPAQLASV
jgi:protoheme ferro-lyase